MTIDAHADLHERHRDTPALEAASAVPQQPEERAGVERRGQRRAERQASKSHDPYEREIDREIGEHGDHADRHRRAAVAERIEAGGGNLHRGVGEQSRRVEDQCRGGGGGIGGCEPPALEEQRHDRMGQRDQPDRGRAR